MTQNRITLSDLTGISPEPLPKSSVTTTQPSSPERLANELSLSSGTLMGLACIVSMRGSSIMRGTQDSCRDCVNHIARRRRARSNAFIGYLKRSFWVPFVASMRQAGLKPDKQAANAAVARWLREVANARVHATTNEVPAE